MAARTLGVERFGSFEYPDLDGITPQLIAAHEQGYAAIKAEPGDLPVGVTLSVTDFQCAGPGTSMPCSKGFPRSSRKALRFWATCTGRFIDNFEWTRGYAPKFGPASVDRTTYDRTLKPSAARLGAIARANGIHR